MTTIRTAWHPPFTSLLDEFRPRWTTVRAEAHLTSEPLRVDDIIEVTAGVLRDPDDVGGTLRGMWPHIRRVGLLEFKSTSRPFRRGNLFQLLAYGWQYLATHQTREGITRGPVPEPIQLDDLTLLLAVPQLTDTLLKELEAMRCTLEASNPGYHRVSGCAMRLVVIDVTTVAEQENDDRLRWFGRNGVQTVAGRRWVLQHTTEGAATMNALKELEGYEDLVRKLVENTPPDVLMGFLTPEQRLAGLPPEQLAHALGSLTPEQRLVGLAPEQRLAGLTPEQVAHALTPEQALLALPEPLLRGLSDDSIASLAPELQARLRARLGR